MKKKDNTPLYISFGIVGVLALLLLYGLNSGPVVDTYADPAQTTGNGGPAQAKQSGKPINENELAKQRSTMSNWFYQSDPTPFDKRPADMTAKEENWSPETHDMMVLIKPRDGRMRPYYIDAFEAFISNYRAWSTPDVYPTDKIKYNSAITACEMAGKRLCTEAEWRTACRGGITTPVAFNNTNEILQYCDFARSSAYDRQDYVEKTDSHIACTPPGLPIYHMIGNLAEFVYGPNNQIMLVGLTYYDGKIKNNQTAVTQACERTVANPGQYGAEQFNKGTGFRCCKDAR